MNNVNQIIQWSMTTFHPSYFVDYCMVNSIPVHLLFVEKPEKDYQSTWYHFTCYVPVSMVKSFNDGYYEYVSKQPFSLVKN